MVKQLWALAMQYPTTSGLVAYWLFSNVVSALPSPQSQTSFYRFVFNLMHGLAGSIGRISPALRIPGPGTTDAAPSPANVTETTIVVKKEEPKP